MPDLLAHLVVAQGCRRAAPRGSLTPWFLVGTILPDVLTRPFNFIFPSLYGFFMPLHTPAGLLLVCALTSEFFPVHIRRLVFLNLLGGVTLHLFLDLLQKHIGGSYHLLFPFSWDSFEFGLIWPETSLYLIPVWLVMGTLMVGRRFFRAKGKQFDY